MAKILSICAFCLGAFAQTIGAAGAQPMSKPEDRIIRPGDTIEWDAPNPHRLRVGGTNVTSLDDVDKILTFSPALTPKLGNIREGDSDVIVRATVRDGADTQGVSGFVFTCGQHPGQMLSHPFQVQAKATGQPSRTLKIRVEGLKWILRKDDNTDVQVDTTP
jgi:hypothetical protein